MQLRYSSRSPKPGVRVRDLHKLRKRLNYSDLRTKRGKDFQADIRLFAQEFVIDGARGSSFKNWKDPDHFAGLEEMANVYLDKDGKGATYWPDDQSSPNYGSYQIGKDREQIHEYLVALFYLGNHEPKTDTAAHEESNSHDAEAPRSMQSNGYSRDSPIHIDANDGDPTRVMFPSPPPISAGNAYSSSTFGVRSAETAGLNPTGNTQTSQPSAPQVPNDSMHSRHNSTQESMPECASHARTPNGANAGSARRAATTDREQRASKRARVDSESDSWSPSRRLAETGRYMVQLGSRPRRNRQIRRNATAASASEVEEATRMASPQSESSLPTVETLCQLQPVMNPDHETVSGFVDRSAVPPVSLSTDEAQRETPAGPENPTSVNAPGSDVANLFTANMSDFVDEFSLNVPPRSATVNVSSPIVSAGCASTDEDDRSNTRPRDRQAAFATMSARPRVTCIFRAILARDPLEWVDWQPSEQFFGHRLNQFLEEVPLDGVFRAERLLFSLICPPMHTRICPSMKPRSLCSPKRPRDFDVMKIAFEKAIRQCIAEASNAEAEFVFEIHVEIFGNEMPSWEQNWNLHQGSIDW